MNRPKRQPTYTGVVAAAQTAAPERAGQQVYVCPVLISCPECGVPAEVTDWFSLCSTDGPVDHVAISCLDGHHFRMAMDRLPADAHEQLRASRDGAGPDMADPLAASGLGTGFGRLPGCLGTVSSP